MTTPQETGKPRKGCLFYGCLTLAVLSLAVLVGGAIGLYYLYQKADAFVAQYGATAPVELPKAQFTDSDRQAFNERFNHFMTGLEAGNGTGPLLLKGEDLDMLLASSPALRVFSEGARLRIEGEEIKGQVSLKLGDLGAPFFKDRYLNGEMALRVSLEDGRLHISPSDVRVNGKALPEEYLSALREYNFAESANQKPEVTRVLERLESIEVGQGTLRLQPRSKE